MGPVDGAGGAAGIDTVAPSQTTASSPSSLSSSQATMSIDDVNLPSSHDDPAKLSDGKTGKA